MNTETIHGAFDEIQQNAGPIRRTRSSQNKITNSQQFSQKQRNFVSELTSLAKVPAAIALSLVSIIPAPVFAAEKGKPLVAQVRESVVIERIDAINRGTYLELVIATPSKQRLLPLIVTDKGKLVIELDKTQLAADIPANVKPLGNIASLESITVNQDSNGSVRITITAAKNQELKAKIAESASGRLAIAIQSAAEIASEPEPKEIEVVATGDKTGFLDKDAGTALGYKEKVIDTPFSIQSVNQDVLQKQQAITLQEALRNVSSVNQGVTFGGINTALTIRGLGGNAVGAKVLRDGYQLYSNFQGIPEINNLSRIEVLKGPSAILYGQGEPGGIINLVQKRATGEKFFDINVQGGSTNGLFRPTLDASGTLNENGSVAFRIPASYQYFDSYRGFDNAFQKTATAPTLLWKANERTEVEIIAEYVNNTTPADFGITKFGTGVANVPVSRVTNDPSDTVTNNFYNIGYKIDYKLNDDWNLSNGFRYLNYNYNYGVVALPLGVSPFDNALLSRAFVTQKYNSNSYSLYTKLTGKFKTGAVEHKLLTSIDLNTSNSVDNFKGDNQQALIDSFFPSFNVFNPVYGPKPNQSALVNATVTEGFSNRIVATVQDQFTIGGKLIAVAGVSYNGVYQQGQAQGDLIGTTPYGPTSQSFSAWTPRAGLLYKLNDAFSLFANYSTGFAPVNILVGASNVPKPITSNGYEVGAKASLLGEKLLATLTWFGTTRNNVVVANPNNPLASIQIGSQKSQGLEFDIVGKLAPGLDLIANYSYIDAFVADDAEVRSFVGKQLPGVPTNQSNLWLNYTFQQGSLAGLGLGVGYSLVGNRQGDLANTFTIGSYGLVNAAISYEWAEKKYRVALNFNNIGNTKYISGTFGSGSTGLEVGSPFAVIGSVGIKF
ncbi:TonB-dependent siderophore receptor [Synechococcus sp. FGCU-3]|nr:TonB-dependent siderophore receptor [Synechococcus sp. FGCU3]